MLAKELGKVDYTIMSFGGFLGTGEQFHPPGTSSPTVPSMTAMWLISTATGLKERLPMPPVKRASGMIPPTAATSSTITSVRIVIRDPGKAGAGAPLSPRPLRRKRP